jgi:hypothetical protein
MPARRKCLLWAGALRAFGLGQLFYGGHWFFEMSKVNPSTPRPEGQGLLRVDPELRFLTPSLKRGLGAAERVKPDPMSLHFFL